MIAIDHIHTVIKRFSKKERNLFYIAVTCVSLALLARLVIAPATEKMQSLDQEIDDIKLLIEKDSHFLSYKDEINSVVSSYASYFGEAGSPEEELREVLKTIEEFASQSSIYLTSRKSTGFEIEGIEKKYSVAIACEGTMVQIIDFIHRIESADMLFEIGRFTIAPKEEGSPIAQCPMTVSKITIP